tara:strand:+ start:20 stop:235 length:216 start_codon:yes stop_codon:yes gene_type:complete
MLANNNIKNMLDKMVDKVRYNASIKNITSYDSVELVKNVNSNYDIKFINPNKGRFNISKFKEKLEQNNGTN